VAECEVRRWHLQQQNQPGDAAADCDTQLEKSEKMVVVAVDMQEAYLQPLTTWDASV
jgi:hypothetical protein